jgi:hypothetical protein
MMMCQHCRQALVSRPRNLCWTCYYRPGVRDLYPATSKFGHRGPGNFYSNRPLPTTPTTAIPGSREKVEVLEERARQKLSLWHPEDAVRDDQKAELLQAG